MRLNNKLMFVVILVIFFGGIGSAMALNVWESKPGVSAKNQATETYPANIKGSNSFAEISQMYGVPLADLKSAFGPNSADKFADMKARDLKNQYANPEKDITVETESVRIFVAMYMNFKYSYSNAAYLPETAVIVLKEKVKLSPEQIKFLEAHIFPAR